MLIAGVTSGRQGAFTSPKHRCAEGFVFVQLLFFVLLIGVLGLITILYACSHFRIVIFQWEVFCFCVNFAISNYREHGYNKIHTEYTQKLHVTDQST